MPPRKRPRPQPTWQDVAQEAQDHRDATLAEIDKDTTCPEHLMRSVVGVPGEILTAKECVITSTTVSNLIQLLSEGRFSAQEVVDAFLRRARLAQTLANCITELLPSRAIARAAALDATFSAMGGPLGPLHGVPISVKSHIGLENCRTPAGYIAWWNNLSARDALVVQILEHAGAVITARTTEPQSMMQLECASNLYGVTVNPHNTAMSSGGSSGGEAALLALGGSAIGVGSDVGGSIRVPAAACGIYGLKPTGFRVPTTGWSSTPPGADPIPTVIGPMCANLDGIELFMRTVLSAEPWIQEPALIPLPWRSIGCNPTQDKPVRVGIAWHDGIVMPHPPITRALEQLVNKIKSIPAVDVVDFQLYKHDEAWAIASSLYFTDGGDADRNAMAESGEPMLPLTRWILEENSGVKKLTREELEYWLEEREEYRLEYARAWNETGRWNEDQGRWENQIDVIISPVAPGIATRHGTAKYWFYSAVWNLLDYPALVFPAGKANRATNETMMRTSFFSGHDKDNWALYDPETFDQMPVGLQIIGRRFEDEKIVAILKYLQSHLR